uniref:Uncharacterized protein n=1 Tax=Rhizophora mucronata TaxID=61149 RepID=A0A2P2PS78_RHIMU
MLICYWVLQRIMFLLCCYTDCSCLNLMFMLLFLSPLLVLIVILGKCWDLLTLACLNELQVLKAYLGSLGLVIKLIKDEKFCGDLGVNHV